SAPARRFLVRVDELEALTHERLLPVERRAVQVEEALLVDEDADVRAVGALEVVDHVAGARLAVVELDDVREARAAAAADADAERRAGDVPLPDLCANRVDRALRDDDAELLRRRGLRRGARGLLHGGRPLGARGGR